MNRSARLTRPPTSLIQHSQSFQINGQLPPHRNDSYLYVLRIPISGIFRTLIEAKSIYVQSAHACVCVICQHVSVYTRIFIFAMKIGVDCRYTDTFELLALALCVHCTQTERHKHDRTKKQSLPQHQKQEQRTIEMSTNCRLLVVQWYQVN